MNREEAKQALKDLAEINVRYGCDDKWITALHMAIEALHREEAEEKGYCHRILPSNVEVVVRCKDCRHHGMRDCPVWGDDTTEDYMWCYYGERREK